jgi:hypothetical protein
MALAGRAPCHRAHSLKDRKLWVLELPPRAGGIQGNTSIDPRFRMVATGETLSTERPSGDELAAE